MDTTPARGRDPSVLPHFAISRGWAVVAGAEERLVPVRDDPILSRRRKIVGQPDEHGAAGLPIGCRLGVQADEVDVRVVEGVIVLGARGLTAGLAVGRQVDLLLRDPPSVNQQLHDLPDDERLGKRWKPVHKEGNSHRVTRFSAHHPTRRRPWPGQR